MIAQFWTATSAGATLLKITIVIAAFDLLASQDRFRGVLVVILAVLSLLAWALYDVLRLEHVQLIVALGSEMLRGVYPERSEWAQHDSTVTQTNAWIHVFLCIIGPYG